MTQEKPFAQFKQDDSYPAPTNLAHISLFSGENFAAMQKFYQTVLNMRVVYVIENKIRFVALSFDQENHRIGLVELSSLVDRPSNAVRIEHTSWRYRTLRELLATVRYVEQELGLFPKAVHQGALMAFSYQDPDTNRCELIVECLGSQEEIIDFYASTLQATPEFDTLMPFDLRAMMAHEERGTSYEILMDYEWCRENLKP